MRTVVRNPFGRNTIMAERVGCPGPNAGMGGCSWCGGLRGKPGSHWLYRFHVSDDQGPRSSGPIADGRMFCSRGCCESYTGQPMDETEVA